MGNVPLNRWVASGCFVLAIILNLGLTEYATQYIMGYAGYSESVRGPLSNPILTTWWTEAMLGCFRQSCQAGGFSSVSGFFARDVVPREIAFWGGIILPILLVTLSTFLAFGFRRLIAVLILLPGLALTGVMSLEIFHEHNFWANLFDRYGTWQGSPLLLAGFAFVAAGIWLWRTRSPKQPA